MTVTFAAVSTYTMSARRVASFAGGIIGVAGIIVGGLALARSRRVGRRAPVLALAAGLIAVVIGGLVVATADGGLGTGNGLGGGIVAMVAGLVAVILGGVAVRRRVT